MDATAVTQKITGLKERVGDISQPLSEAGDELLQYFGPEVFNAQGIAGEAWRDLAPTTQKARERHWGYYVQPSGEGPARRILVWTGRLMAGFKKEVATMSLRIFNDVEYAKYHQYDYPTRRILALTKDVLATVRTKVRDYLIKV